MATIGRYGAMLLKTTLILREARKDAHGLLLMVWASKAEDDQRDGGCRNAKRQGVSTFLGLAAMEEESYSILERMSRQPTILAAKVAQLSC